MKNLVLLVLLFKTGNLFSQQNVELKKATTHPIQYYISLPADWNAKKTWPVLIAVEGADKEFAKNAERFAAVRAKLPFIIVSPVITTNGNQGKYDPKVYPYSTADWKFIDSVSTCEFDTKGIAAIIKDIKTLFHGEDKVYLTGYEAGAHLVWTLIFSSPENIYAAAPVAGNFQSRCVEEISISNDDFQNKLPVLGISGANDVYFGPNGKLYNQYERAKALATAHGYKNVSEKVIEGKDHVPLPEEVIEWFATFLKK